MQGNLVRLASCYFTWEKGFPHLQDSKENCDYAPGPITSHYLQYHTSQHFFRNPCQGSQDTAAAQLFSLLVLWQDKNKCSESHLLGSNSHLNMWGSGGKKWETFRLTKLALSNVLTLSIHVRFLIFPPSTIINLSKRLMERLLLLLLLLAWENGLF